MIGYRSAVLSIASASILALITGCTSVSTSTRLSYPLSAAEYNDLVFNYVPRPTYISLEQMSDGQTVLAIEMQQYGNTPSPTVEPNFQFRMMHSAISQYVALLDKYEAWREQAEKRGDAITKVIGRAPAWGQVSGSELEFRFHSGNVNQHFLVISFCAARSCLEDRALVFDSENVARLRDILQKWDSGQIKSLNVDADYR